MRRIVAVDAVTALAVTFFSCLLLLLLLLLPESGHAFSVVAPLRPAAPFGHRAKNAQRHHHQLCTAGATSSFLPAKGASSAGRTGECSSTSLLSSYEVKAEMARNGGSEWRKLRTRGPGFGEKVWFVRPN